MLASEGRGLPVAVHTAPANKAEVHLIGPTLENVSILFGPPEHLLYDRAADSDPLREQLAEQHGVELVCPHRKNRTTPPLQDGRSLRRYKRRYKIERSISWLQRFHRLITRWEYYPELFEGFVHLACLYNTMQRL